MVLLRRLVFLLVCLQLLRLFCRHSYSIRNEAFLTFVLPAFALSTHTFSGLNPLRTFIDLRPNHAPILDQTLLLYATLLSLLLDLGERLLVANWYLLCWLLIVGSWLLYQLLVMDGR